MEKTNEFYDAFISYRHHTGFYMANLIYERLTANGYNIYIDKRLRSSDESYVAQLKKAIESSSNFILVLFPEDLDKSSDDSDWLRREAQWAVDAGLHLISAVCDGFTVKPETLPDHLKEVVERQGIQIHKDYMLDNDLDKLCVEFMKNTHPVKPIINTKEFFEKNLDRDNAKVKRVDLAFHGGHSWRNNSENKPILDRIIGQRIPVRILINTPEAAESIAKYMRDWEADYKSFAELEISWREYAALHPDLIEVRKCSIPLLRVYHAIEYYPVADGAQGVFDRIHVKYYAYKNYYLEKAFEHELSSFSKYYAIYQNEFAYLWEQSEPV